MYYKQIRNNAILIGIGGYEKMGMLAKIDEST